VKLIEVLATNTKIYIVLELCSGGDLFDNIREQKYVNKMKNEKEGKRI